MLAEMRRVLRVGGTAVLLTALHKIMQKIVLANKEEWRLSADSPPL